MKFIVIAAVFTALTVLWFCSKKSSFDPVKTKADVLKTVFAHNKAWTELEDINEQKKYIHEDIIFISPPYNKPITCAKEYLRSYQEDWMDHAVVHHFSEVNPEVKLYNNGTFAVVTYEIDMTFDYDDNKVPEWHGIDKMTLVKENGRWLITSDMYAKQTEEE